MGLSAHVNYELRMAELKEIYEFGCISLADYRDQAHEYWLLLATARQEVPL